jgi:hypothetical protein
MNKYSVVRRTIKAFSFLAIIVALSSLGSGCFAGGDPERDTGFKGVWTGKVTAPDGNISRMTLTLQSPGKTTKDKSTLIYESPRDCTLTVVQKDNDREYSLTESSGGFCDKLLLGKLSVTKQGDNTLSYGLTSLGAQSSPKISEKGTLHRSGK